MIGSPARTPRDTAGDFGAARIALPHLHRQRMSRALADQQEISQLLKDENNFVWFDLAEPTATDLALLQSEFALHPTAIEDAHWFTNGPRLKPSTATGWSFCTPQRSIAADGSNCTSWPSFWARISRSRSARTPCSRSRRSNTAGCPGHDTAHAGRPAVRDSRCDRGRVPSDRRRLR